MSGKLDFNMFALLYKLKIHLVLDFFAGIIKSNCFNLLFTIIIVGIHSRFFRCAELGIDVMNERDNDNSRISQKCLIRKLFKIGVAN